MWLNDDDRASWTFVEGSISVSASVLIAHAISKCQNCGDWPIIGFFKSLTEQDGGILTASMALLFPTTLGFYLGAKLVFAAYRGYRQWRDEQVARREAELEEARKKARAEGHAEGHAEGQTEGQQSGRLDERARVRRKLQELGIVLNPEDETALFGEPQPPAD